jgi:hypothetical protein
VDGTTQLAKNQNSSKVFRIADSAYLSSDEKDKSLEKTREQELATQICQDHVHQALRSKVWRPYQDSSQ